MIHEIVTQFPGTRAQTIRPDVRRRLHQQPGRVQGRGTEKDDACRVLRPLVGHGVEHAHSDGALPIPVIDDLGDYRERLERRPAGRQRSWQGRRLGAEIGAVRATQPAGVAVLARAPARQRLRDVGDPRRDDPATPVKGVTQAPGDQLLGAIELNRRLKLAVGQLRQAFGRTGNPGEPLDMVVPRCQILVPDGPVDRHSVARIRLEIEITQTIALPPPQQRATSDLIATKPVEAANLRVRRILVRGPPVEVLLVERIVAPENGIRLLHRERATPAMRILPRALEGVNVVSYVLDILAALEQQHVEALLAQLLRRPAAGNPGADDDSVVAIRLHDPPVSSTSASRHHNA